MVDPAKNAIDSAAQKQLPGAQLNNKTELNENIHHNDNSAKNGTEDHTEKQKFTKGSQPLEVLGRDGKKVDEFYGPDVVSMSDIIGHYGLYQLSLTLIAFIRYVCVAMMTNTGPLIAPSVPFSCKLPDNSVFSSNQLVKPQNMTIDEFLKDKCRLDLTNGSTYECSSWIFNTTQYGVTLTDSFDLVCRRDWLRSAFQSWVSIGVVIASLIWGSFSDMHGRLVAVRVTFVCSLVSGVISYFADNLLLYAIARSICSFSDLGLVVSLTTIIVETLGNKYRGAVSIIVYTGWALGVMIMPWLTDYFRDYRQLMLFTIMCHILSLPWLMTIHESVRWCLVNGRIDEAGEELRRISKWNLKGDKRSLDEVDRKFNQFKMKFVQLDQKKGVNSNEESEKGFVRMVYLSTFGGLSKVKQLLQSRELVITTSTLVWTQFNCELLYMLFIMINSDIGDNVKLNYAIGGVMELLATLISIVMIARMARKLSLLSTLLLIAFLCFVLAFTHSDPSTSVWALNLTKLAISTLSSLLFVVATEMFPTNLRQTGFGLSGTLSSFGAVIAPFIRTELVDMIGMTKVMLLISVLTLTAATIIPFFLRETKGVELPDDVEEIENEISGLTSRRASKQPSDCGVVEIV